MADAFVNRGDEFALLRARLRSGTSHGSVIVVTGGLGVGKSALIEAAASDASELGYDVVRSTGVRSETHLPFAGLHELMQPLIRDVEKLGEAQRTTILNAFGRFDAVHDRYAISLAWLSLIRTAAERRPLLILAEDAQWLDPASLEVLAFAGRRITADPVVLIISGRRFPGPAAGFEELELQPLDDVNSALLVDLAAPQLTQHLRHRVLREAEGNPLALVELGAFWTHQPPTSGEPSQGSPTVLTERIFETRLESLSSSTRSMLLIAACSDSPEISAVLAAASLVSESSVEPIDFAAAVDARLVTLDGVRVRFRHPLVRSIVYQRAALQERQAAHMALSLVLSDERAVWHRAAATVVADEGVAAELEQAAAVAQRRGAISAVIPALRRAADLSPSPRSRGRRLISAAEACVESGAIQAAAGLLDEAEVLPLATTDRARGRWLRHQLRLTIDPEDIDESLAIAEQLRATGDRDLAVGVLLRTATAAHFFARDSATLHTVRSAGLACAAADDPRLIFILAACSPAAAGGDLLDRLRAARHHDRRDANGLQLLATAGALCGAAELVDEAADAAVDLLRARGQVRALCQALAVQAWVAWTLGYWDRTITASEEAARLGSDVDQAGAWIARLATATALAARGETSAAVETLHSVQPQTESAGPQVRNMTMRAFAMVAAAREEPGEAFDLLHQVFVSTDLSASQGATVGALPLYIDAAIDSGQRSAAESMVSDISHSGWAAGSPETDAGLRYAGAILSTGAEAERRFEEALVAPTLVRRPFAHACLLLRYGGWLRRERREREARIPLRESRDAFDRLGAESWARRAREELRASGEVSPRRTRRAADQLTPQELEIALLAAQGMTNREIGQQLYLSHRTIGTHLYRIFPKLGVASRHELRAVIGELRPAQQVSARLDRAP